MDTLINHFLLAQNPQQQQQQQQQQQLLAESSPPQIPQHVQHPHAAQYESRATSNVGQATPNSISTQSTTTPDLDMSDFTTLSDIGGPPTQSSNHLSTAQSFYPFQSGYYVSSAPYNAIAYGSAWSQIPVSSYSTLNGATSSSTAAPSPSTSNSSSSQQQQSSQSQPMIIDPALTTMNGSSSGLMPNHFTQSSNSPPQNNTQQSSAMQRQFPFQTYAHPTLPISTSYLHASHYPPAISQTQSQGTLSPQALHSPSAIVGAHPPTSFYTHPSPQSLAPSGSSSVASGSSTTHPKPSPGEQKAQFQTTIKPLLVSAAFTGAQAVNALLDKVDDYGIDEVDAATRMEILTKIRDGAGNHYFRAWAENPFAMDVTREWLKAGFGAKTDDPLVETVMPLLHIIDRLPLTVETLKTSKLGKLVVKLVKDPPSPAIKDMASNIERRWRQMITTADNGSKGTDPNKTEVKKRKPEASPQKNLPPPKKPAVGTPSSLKPMAVKKEVKPAVTAVKDAKSDSSFFSAPKPKPKLPSFKKAPPAPMVKKEQDLNVAQPSSIDPFQEALKFMAKARKDSPAVATPPPASETPPQVSGPSKIVKKRKSVTWAPDGQLESIQLIERAVYDDDPVDGVHGLHSLRELDRGEGAALHAHLSFEESLDWFEPPPIEFPVDVELRPRGEQSEEREAQELREQTALSAAYMSAAHIPASPAEPTTVIPEEDVDKEVVPMTSGPEVDAVFWSAPMTAATPAAPGTSSSVADLVSQLSNGAGLVPGVIQPTVPDLVSVDPQAALQAMQSLPQDQLQQLLQRLSSFQQPSAPPPPQQGYINGPGPEQQWSSGSYGGYYNDSEAREPWSSERGSGRGRGRGRGRGGFRGDDGYRHSKRRPCSFFAAGRCKYGDQCDFAHDIGGAGTTY